MIQECDSRRIGICIIFVLLTVLSGCITDPVSVDATVGGDGTIESYEIRMNMSQESYNYLERTSRSEGYASVGKYLKNRTTSRINTQNVKNIEYSESSEGENKTVTVRLEGYTPSESSSISATKQNGSLVYEDRTFFDPDAGYGRDMPGGIPVHYTLTMPGKIQNSTADTVEGDTATWELNDFEVSQTRIRAKSEVSTGFGISGIPDAGGLAPLLIPLVIGVALAYWVR